MSFVKPNRASDLRKKSGNSSTYKQREMNKLDIDNKQMEWRLHQLKQTMELEKKERKNVGNLWKSSVSKTPTPPKSKKQTISSSRYNLLKKDKSRRVKVLKDEPLEISERRTNYTRLIEKLSNEDPILSQKNNLSKTDTKLTWISIARKKDSNEIMDIQSDIDGNLPLSSVQSINAHAIGVFYLKWGRKRIIPAVDGLVMRPKAGWGDETYYPYVSGVNWQEKNNLVANFNLYDNELQPQKKKIPVPPPNISKKEESGGGLLFQGEFNEEESAKSFQMAVQQWRNNSSSRAPSRNAATAEMSCHAVQSEPVEIEIKFSSTSTLTDQEKEMLKRHRSSVVPPLNVERNNGIRKSFDNCENFQTYQDLSDEIKIERKRMQEIFSNSLPKTNDGDLINNNNSYVTFTEVDSNTKVEIQDETANCIVEPPQDKIIDKNPQQISSVTIKEFDYLVDATENKINKLSLKTPDKKVSNRTLDPQAAYNPEGLHSFFTDNYSPAEKNNTFSSNPTQLQTEITKCSLTESKSITSWNPQKSVIYDENVSNDMNCA